MAFRAAVMLNTNDLKEYRNQLIADRDDEITAITLKYQARISAVDVLLATNPPTDIPATPLNGLTQNGNTTIEVQPVSLVDTVRRAISAVSKMHAQRHFDSRDILSYIRQHFPQWREIASTDLSNRLWHLRTSGELEVVTQGSGRTPSVYRPAPNFV